MAIRKLSENTSVENLSVLSNLVGEISRDSEGELNACGIRTCTEQPGSTLLLRRKRFIYAIVESS
jgi:hypothetical protein